jgi:hypothetical protein
LTVALPDLPPRIAKKRALQPRTAEQLEALWRPHPAFIGPVAPPMVLWARDRERQRQWRATMNLAPVENHTPGIAIVPAPSPSPPFLIRPTVEAEALI